METTKKDLEYYRKNAEENYLTTPISVLRYITELEQVLRVHDVVGQIEPLVCPKCGDTGRCEPRTLSDPDGQECDCRRTCL